MLTSHPHLNSFVPPWWARNGHVQTLWGKFARRTSLPPGRIERWATPDNDFLDVFRVDAPPTAPRVLVLHGLEGTIHSHYVRGILTRAARAGWGADLLIFRGCGTELNHAPRFYHSGETGDLDFAARRISIEFPSSPLFVVGYSLGGNVLLKWLGESHRRHPTSLRAAAAVSVPFDLEAGAHHIHHGFARVYEQHFLRTLKRKAREKLLRFPGIYGAGSLDLVDSIVGFDNAVTAPLHGFVDAHDYYTRSSSLQFLPSVRVPTALISAFDDPFLPPDVLERVRVLAQANSAFEIHFSLNGGHVGFVTGANPAQPTYYSEARVWEFFAPRVVSPAHSLRSPLF